MRARRPAVGTAVAVFVLVAVVVGGALAFVALTPGSSTPDLGNSNSGPISTYPAAWTDACGLPVQGNDTTSDQIGSGYYPGAENFTLQQVYAKIVDSASFQNYSRGLDWVTSYWGMEQTSGPSGTFTYVVGQFVLVSGDQPDGYVQADYNLGTGQVSTTYERYLVSSCPAIISSSSGATLTRYSPAYYAIGAPVGITFYFVDDTEPSMTVSSGNSCLGSFSVLQGVGTTGQAVYNSTAHDLCTGSPVDVTLHPGQSYNQTVYWNQTDDAGQQVPSGAYEVMYTEVDGPAFSSPVGEVYIASPQQTVNSSILQDQFYYQGSVVSDVVSPGQPIKVVWTLANQGQQVYGLYTSDCSYEYTITSLTGVVFDSARAASCGSQLQDDPAPPQGGISHTAYWNQTDQAGAAVPPGVYRAVIELHVWSGGQESNMTSDSDFMITPSAGAQQTGDQISVASSSLCAVDCGGAGPYLDSAVDANGQLESLQLYFNGTYIGTMNYSLNCCQLGYQVTFDTPLPGVVVPGVSYDIIFVGTFQDGNTSISWANPINRLVPADTSPLPV